MYRHVISIQHCRKTLIFTPAVLSQVTDIHLLYVQNFLFFGFSQNAVFIPKRKTTKKENTDFMRKLYCTLITSSKRLRQKNFASYVFSCMDLYRRLSHRRVFSLCFHTTVFHVFTVQSAVTL